MGEKIKVGSAIAVGDWTDAFGDEVAELGAAVKKGLNPTALQRFASNINNRVSTIEAQAQANPVLRPLAKLGAGVRAVTQATLAAAASQRVKATRDSLEMATHIIPVCFDAIPATTLSPIATVKAPHNQPWRVLAFLTNDAECIGPRFTSLKFGNTEHVVTSNVTFSASAPTSPGIDAGDFSGKMHRGLLPQLQYRPWGVGPSGWLKTSAEVLIQMYNPTSSAKSVNFSILVQSSPCGDEAFYDANTAYSINSPMHRKMMQRVSKGMLSLWRRAR